MLHHFKRKLVTPSLTLLLAGAAVSSALAANPGQVTETGATSANAPITASVVLRVHNQEALENFARDVSSPGTSNFRQFLTTEQFAAKFGASDEEIRRVTRFLQRNGIQVNEVASNHLLIKATGTAAQFNTAFGIGLRDYVRNGRAFHRPNHNPSFPAELADVVTHVSGLSNESFRTPKNHRSLSQPDFSTTPNFVRSATASTNGSPSVTFGTPLTVFDVANIYDINPLYAAGINGAGSTVGIVTLADFNPSDAYAYWTLIGLPVKSNRILDIPVDGGGQLSADAGSDETTLDVEQSGGLAPQANIRVYQAPNTDPAFIDAFNQAISDNVVDSISTSWGEPEVFLFPTAFDGNIDNRGEFAAFHQLYLEAAVQGISLFAASGDSGAYDTNRDGAPYPFFTKVLTVDHPASDPAITSAGGTTLPYSHIFRGATVPFVVPTEEVWGWQGLQDYLNTDAGRNVDLFSAGGGGGVSIVFQEPFYQLFTHGIRKTEPNQNWVDIVDGNIELLKLPANFHGRNQPDVSLNADPEVGYFVYTTLPGEGSIQAGGTSFVAPQLNGITALLKQADHRRIGFWNPQIYLLQNVVGYRGSFSPFHDITHGDNWFYSGIGGYDDGAGIGTLDVANLALWLNAF